MANMGNYCKAYPIHRFRTFGAWTESSQNARKEKQQIDGKEVEVPRQLTDNDFLYLQENFVVTDGIFLDENIIYDHLIPEWVEYCKTELRFEVPVWETARVQDPGEAAAQVP
jgi:hypothetical protein